MHSISKAEKKAVNALAIKKYRQSEEQFVVEGVKPVEELLIHAPQKVEKVYLTPQANFDRALVPAHVALLEVSEKDLKGISNLKSPQGVLAVAQFLEISPKTKGLTLVLDNIQDPGNLGTIIRSAEWFGVKEIICSKETVDVYNPKVVQAAMGSIFRVAINYVDLKAYLETSSLPIYGALLEGENVYTADLNAEGILIMGNEGKGITPEIITCITHPVTIPKMGEGESLNVSIASAVLLSEFARRTSL
ncbi:RNA methyltransferase, TrmH family [Lishizhenia tianjinensis]|uniref:RNA methyltransferase, TrmH family n=1 Tax=Lishizhenia tianjinensis TaxID=477690 RepID=A0A1I7ANV5_9FLAO|nr:RNA methyltransferase [Lishizhenia tianjinensis]SFT76503.1 RNA methyltransferase, TrmH family [Lishizhenia tianjinensis]